MLREYVFSAVLESFGWWISLPNMPVFRNRFRNSRKIISNLRNRWINFNVLNLYKLNFLLIEAIKTFSEIIFSFLTEWGNQMTQVLVLCKNQDWQSIACTQLLPFLLTCFCLAEQSFMKVEQSLNANHRRWTTTYETKTTPCWS